MINDGQHRRAIILEKGIKNMNYTINLSFLLF